MSTDRTCNSSFWTREEDEIFENTLAIYFSDNYLLRKMEEALPGKSSDDIKDHFNILLEDIHAIESGRVPLPNYPEMQSNANQISKADVEWRKGTPWTEQEHRSFLRGLNIYGKGDWRSISRHCVIRRTAMQVASHAQEFFNHLEAANKGKRGESVLYIMDAEAAGTSQIPNTENMIGPACGGSQAVPNTSSKSMLPQESTNAGQQMIAVAGGIDDLMTEQEDAKETMFFVDTAGRSLSPSKQLCTAASSGSSSHPISRIGSELEALLSEAMDEDNDISSIFDVGNAPAEVATVFIPPWAPSSNTPIDDEALFFLDNLFIDQMF